MLEQFGVTSAASRIYSNLLERPAKLRDITAINQELSPDEAALAMQELADYGLILVSEGGIVAVPPGRAVELLISRKESDLIAQQSLLATYRELRDAFKASLPQYAISEIDTVRGSTAIWESLQRLNAQARFQMDTFAPGGALDAKAIETSQAVDAELVSRGVKSRGIYLSSAKKDYKTLNHLFWLSQNGSEIRVAQKLPIRMIIFDKKIAVLPSNLVDAMDGITIYHNSAIAKALQELFELTWITAQPLGFKPTEVKKGLSEPEKVILEMIGQGKNDAEIGKKLGVVDRTVRRRITAVMDRLGVASREEAIYQAAKNGWI